VLVLPLLLYIVLMLCLYFVTSCACLNFLMCIVLMLCLHLMIIGAWITFLRSLFLLCNLLMLLWIWRQVVLGILFLLCIVLILCLHWMTCGAWLIFFSVYYYDATLAFYVRWCLTHLSYSALFWWYPCICCQVVLCLLFLLCNLLILWISWQVVLNIFLVLCIVLMLHWHLMSGGAWITFLAVYWSDFMLAFEDKWCLLFSLCIILMLCLLCLLYFS
jgi:hypothetical protein